MNQELRNQIAVLLAAGENARAEEVMRAAQKGCTHEWGPWSGIGASQRFCKKCGAVENDF